MEVESWAVSALERKWEGINTVIIREELGVGSLMEDQTGHNIKHHGEPNKHEDKAYRMCVGDCRCWS